jgi:hypothetical protein
MKAKYPIPIETPDNPLGIIPTADPRQQVHRLGKPRSLTVPRETPNINPRLQQSRFRQQGGQN